MDQGFFINFLSEYCGIDKTLQSCLQGIYNFLVAIAVLVAFFVFLFGAFENLLSTIPDVKMQGKNRMKNAIIGLVIIFISGVVLYWINPYIFSARLILFQITKLEIPLLIDNQTVNYNVNGTNYQISVPKLKNIDQIDSLKNCISPTYKIRMTAYYLPLVGEEDTLHAFLSQVTLQGSGFVNNNKHINFDQAQWALNNFKPQDKEVVKCKAGWRWSWINFTSGETKGCDPAYTKNTSRKESVKKEIENPDGALNQLKNKAYNGFPNGSYGPLIPLRTVAHNRSQGVFNKGDIIRVLSCLDQDKEVSCRLQNTNLIVTDTGGGESKGADAWLDFFAGVGGSAIRTATQYKTDYVKVCKVGKTQL